MLNIFAGDDLIDAKELEAGVYPQRFIEPFCFQGKRRILNEIRKWLFLPNASKESNWHLRSGDSSGGEVSVGKLFHGGIAPVLPAAFRRIEQ